MGHLKHFFVFVIDKKENKYVYNSKCLKLETLFTFVQFCTVLVKVLLRRLQSKSQIFKICFFKYIIYETMLFNMFLSSLWFACIRIKILLKQCLYIAKSV